MKTAKEFWNVSVESTEDCIKLIDPDKKFNFKRKTKFKLKDCDVRVFVNKEKNVVSVVSESNSVRIFDLDLSEFKETFDLIKKHAEQVYTHDYGEVWFNPFNRKVWVSGGDGGIMYFKGTVAELKKLDEDQIYDLMTGANSNSDSDTLGFDKIPGVSEEIIEAECSPQKDDGETDFDYIEAATCKDISEVIDY